MSKKLISLFLTIILFTSTVLNCYANGDNTATIMTEVFVRQQLIKHYALIYDTFDAAITLDDGSEITGIGFTDYSAYYEAEDGSVGYFPAGFVADVGYVVPDAGDGKAWAIENLDFTDDRYQFVYDCETVPFMEHCVKDGQYLKYGVNQQGAISFETSPYERGVCDESLGALYSFDTGKYVFDPDVGNYVQVNGTTLFDQIDYDAIKIQVDQLIADQNNRFSEQEIVSNVHLAQEAIVSYLLSMQEETFLGYKVAELVDYASQLDPMECVRITSEGLVVIRMTDDLPNGPEELTKWLVGIGCGIVVIGSIALNVFFPFARPLCGAITGAAIDVFMQVVINNKSLENIRWEKVAVAAVSGAMMAWVCPMAASGITDVVTKAGGKVLGKLAGYGLLTVSNGLTQGFTRYADAALDGKDGWDAFRDGLLLGAVSTAGASILAEVMPFIGPKVTDILNKTKIGSKITSALGKVNNAASKAAWWIEKRRVVLPEGYEKLESILSPKSVHQAAESAWREINYQTGALGGRYDKLTTPGDYSQQKHEIPSCDAYNRAKGLPLGKRSSLPAIKMSAEDHALTASYGSSADALKYRMEQYNLICKGNITSAIKMDIDNLHDLFGSKYDEAIKQAIAYAAKEGLWKPWTENNGIFYLILESVGLTLEEIVPQ